MRGRRWVADQRGVVLVVSLLVLLMLGVIAVTVARTNRLQLHMAGNDEAGMAALQLAMAAAESALVSAIGPVFPGGLDYRLCTPLSAAETCDERTLALAPTLAPDAGSLDVSIVRMAPLLGRLPVMAEGKASSAIQYRVATLEVQVSYDGIEEGQGRAVLAQGVLVRLPAPLQVDGGTP